MSIATAKDCSPKHSFFKFIDEVWKSTESKHTLHRICTLMRKMGASTIITEEITPKSFDWPRVLEELTSIEVRLQRKVPYNIQKFTFLLPSLVDPNLASSIPIKATHLSSCKENDFLGYAIIINLELIPSIFKSYVFESVIRENGFADISSASKNIWRSCQDYYLHIKRRFSATVCEEKTYNITGTYFCQQNTLTSVCGHACAAMMLNNCKSNSSSKIVTCQRINDLLGIDQVKRMGTVKSAWGTNDKATHAGLSFVELEKIFRQFSYTPYRLNFTSGESQRHYRPFLYGFIESGYPALLSFLTGSYQHVVASFGHTLNSDSWFPTAFTGYALREKSSKSHMSSLDWVDTFIVNDDNFGMQYCLPAQSFKADDHPDPRPQFTPVTGLGIYPSAMGIRILSYQAEQIAALQFNYFATALFSSKLIPVKTFYLNHFLFQQQRGNAVLRTLLVSQQDYLEHLNLKDCYDKYFDQSDKDEIRKIIQNHENLWLVEFTEPELFAGNKSKVIDVLIDPCLEKDYENNPLGLRSDGLVLMRLPGILLIPGKDDNRFKQVKTLNVDGHFPMYTSKHE
jgi:hypothetical protein